MLVRRGDRRGVWVESPEIRRRLQGDFLLGRACGLRRGYPQRILDATAGLGVDGLALALAGAQVHLVERDAVLWALLHNLLERLEIPGVELTRGDAGKILAGDTCWDVVYFDPMFPARGKTALPGKRMQYLAALLGEGDAFDQPLLAAAREKATARVVLKRRLKDTPLADPDWSIRGRSVRYDVYRGRASDLVPPSGRAASDG